MLVRDVMTSPAVTVHLDTPLRRVAHLLDEHSITALPVVDGHGCLVGVVSEADLLFETVPHDRWRHEPGHAAATGPYVARAADVMTFRPVTVAPGTELTEATDLMSGSSVRSLPVVDGDVVVGMVSRRDVVRVLARGDTEIAAEVAGLLHGLEQDWRVEVDDGVVLAAGPDDAHQQQVVRGLAITVPGVVAVRFPSRPAEERRTAATPT